MWGSLASVRAADAEALQQVDGIGTEKAGQVVAELVELAPLIDRLVLAGDLLTVRGPVQQVRRGVGGGADGLDV